MRKILVCLLIILSISGGIIAAESKGTISDDTVHLRAGYLKYIDDEINISEGVTIIKGNNKITAPRGKLYKSKNKAELKSGVMLNNDDGTINSERMVAWLNENKYIFKEKVILKQQKDSGKEMKLQTSYLELYTDDNSFQTDQGVVIHYDKRIIKAQKAKYNDQKQTLELEDKVRIQEENGDWITGDNAIFYLNDEEDEFVMDKNVEMEIDLSGNE